MDDIDCGSPSFLLNECFDCSLFMDINDDEYQRLSEEMSDANELRSSQLNIQDIDVEFGGLEEANQSKANPADGVVDGPWKLDKMAVK